MKIRRKRTHGELLCLLFIFKQLLKKHFVFKALSLNKFQQPKKNIIDPGFEPMRKFIQMHCVSFLLSVERVLET